MFKSKIFLYACIALLVVAGGACAFLFTGKSPDTTKAVYTRDIGTDYYTLTLEGNHWTSECAERRGAEDIASFKKGTFVKNGDYALFTTESSGYYSTLFGKKSLYIEDTEINSGEQSYVYFGKDYVVGEFNGSAVLFQEGAKYAPTDVLAIYGQNRLTVNYNCDIYVEKNEEESIFKNDVFQFIYAMNAEGEYYRLMNGINDIKSVKVNGQDFTTSFAKGRYNAIVTYGTQNNTFDMVIWVGTAEESPTNMGIYIQGLTNADVYTVPIGTTVEQFLAGKNATIRSTPDATPTPITPQMINHFNTTKEFKGYFNIAYQGRSCSFVYSVYNETNPGAYDIGNFSLDPFVELGNEINFSFQMEYYNHTFKSTSIGESDVIVENYNENQTGLQEISVTYDGITKNIVVYVFNADDNPGIALKNVPHIEINLDNTIQNLTFNLLLANHTDSAPIELNLDMVKNLDLTKRVDGYYLFEYETPLYTFVKKVYVNFIDFLV